METGHGRHAFASEIRELEHDLLEMGSRAESMLAQAVESIVRVDANLALQVVKRDDEIDERELAIENRCVRLLALQQPMAGDLRTISTALKLITDIERVGDLSVDIAKIAMKIEKEMGSSDLIDIPKIASVARAMLRDSMEAYVRRDLDLVEKVCKSDDEVDELYRLFRGQLHERMQTHPDDVVVASWLLLAIHHVERIADHAVNIAERVSFMVTGKWEQLAKSHKSTELGL
ncbi:MAG: phosphate transport system regulatory protein PhoU [Armatimonadetes bacterium 55-13]|nr:phosphate signaling complex protein PhoU [Armatimonadota bacterium]OJU64931.1 MAG: phosphate transport system regulatory protein PhoU [Armatimonadetes bacterium 55-13]